MGRVPFSDAGHGFDLFGLHPGWVAAAARLGRWAYEGYFRVCSTGAEHIPASGAAILAANHGGLLPLDGAMLWLDVLRHTDPPRVPRAVADLFVPLLPVVGTAFARLGVVGGARRNSERLLEMGELLLVFPEGTPGIGKAWRDRYRLQPFRIGHAELALRFRAPVVPVALVGPDEQWPELVRLDVHPFGAPYLPVPWTPVPLPVRYHIRYGAPLALHEGLSDAERDDPEQAAHAAARVRAAVEALLADTLRERRGLFR